VLPGRLRLFFKIDIVLFDDVGDRPLAVLDTKYKGSELPSEQDMQQILAYAGEMGVKEAYLIYPSTITEKIDLAPTACRPIRVQSLVFDLAGDIDTAGEKILHELGVA
jgi:5-methylcytosine-specific restriction endonuclease McrBC regulatory subunit McrC